MRDPDRVALHAETPAAVVAAHDLVVVVAAEKRRDAASGDVGEEGAAMPDARRRLELEGRVDNVMTRGLEGLHHAEVVLEDRLATLVPGRVLEGRVLGEEV